MKHNWKKHTNEYTGDNLFTARDNGFTLMVSEKPTDNPKTPHCTWIISNPKAPFNICSKKILYSLERCKKQCEEILNQLLEE